MTRQQLLVYMFVVLVWGTTPLAINWSVIGAGSWFSLLVRMMLGLLLCLSLLLFSRRKLRFDKVSILHYMTASVGIWLAMGLIYLGTPYIDSGFISVVFGITPFFTGIFAVLLLNEPSFNPIKIVALIIAFVGITLIYLQSITQGNWIFYGLSLVFLGMVSQSLVSVILKKINASVSALETTSGALLFGIIPLFLCWLFFEGSIPNLSQKALFSIAYLGFFASVFGFIGYYYLIKHININQVGLIPLLTPIFSLIIGYFFNQEIINISEFIGVILILLGVAIYQFLGYRV